MVLVIGLVAGVLASLIVGGTGHGLIGDIAVGVLGAFVGSWAFRVLSLHVPLAGLAGTILVSTIGAIISLLVLHLIQRRRRSDP